MISSYACDHIPTTEYTLHHKKEKQVMLEKMTAAYSTPYYQKQPKQLLLVLLNPQQLKLKPYNLSSPYYDCYN
ncbi:hypothetical protein GQX74_005725 [Glossina fuscipes]|nr:hypothetical protein GQX74_005725 [Glossina fuscipes]